MHNQSTKPVAAPGSVYRPVWRYFASEGSGGLSANLLQNAIFFWTFSYHHWGLQQNLLLATGQGFCYAIGALSAGPISKRSGRRRLVAGVYMTLIALCLIAAFTSSQMVLVPVLMLYAGCSAAAWPALESLISEGATGIVLSRRLAAYNLVWSGAAAISVAGSGAMIARWQSSIFLVPIFAHLIGLLLILSTNSAKPATAAPVAAEPLVAEAELLQLETTALWLSRIALPSTYVVAYGLMAIMPSLPVMQPIGTAGRTLLGATWFIGRWVAFIILGATAFWHTRPKLLLWATSLMLVAFLGIVTRPGDLFPGAHPPLMIDVLSMVAWQVLLGAAMGIIYSSSLYFGMVLSHGSTEHGGYHEALIGAGAMLGPGAAALAQWRWPGQLMPCVLAVAGVIVLSLSAAIFAAIKAGQRDRQSLAVQS